MAKLAERGLDETEREKVEGWLALVGKLDDRRVAVTESDDGTERDRRNTLIQLREWYEEWSEVARVALPKKRDLMRVGLARQKARASGESDSPVEPDVQPKA